MTLKAFKGLRASVSFSPSAFTRFPFFLIIFLFLLLPSFIFHSLCCCHLVPSEAHLSLVQVSSVTFVQRWESECQHAYVVCGQASSPFTQLWKRVASCMFFSQIIMSICFQCVRCYFLCTRLKMWILSYATYREREGDYYYFSCIHFFCIETHRRTISSWHSWQARLSSGTLNRRQSVLANNGNTSQVIGIIKVMQVVLWGFIRHDWDVLDWTLMKVC